MTDSPFSLPATYYDQAILHPAMGALFEGSGFYNLGYWRGPDGARLTGTAEASNRLVSRHIELDERRETARTVADIGCGLGATTARFAAAYPGALTIGVNYSAAQLNRARETAPGARMVTMDAARLAFADGSLDRMHSIEAACHFLPRAAFFREAARVLAPAGLLIISDVVPRAPNNVVPAMNVVADIDAYVAEAVAAGLVPVQVEDITAETLPPFAATMRARSLPNIARYFEKLVGAYLLAVFARPG